MKDLDWPTVGGLKASGTSPDLAWGVKLPVIPVV